MVLLSGTSPEQCRFDSYRTTNYILYTRRCIILVLSRMVGESIIINTKIEVTVLEIRGNRVVLGTAAPRDISVRRKEKLTSEMEGTEVEKQE